jgi:hypothetical protein
MDKILNLENNPELLEFTCPSTGVLAWPTIRMESIRMIMSDLLYKSQPLLDMYRKISLIRTCKMLLRATAHNIITQPKKSQVLIYCTGAGQFERNGYSFNRYTGYFSASLDENTWSIEGQPCITWPLPRTNGQLSFSTPTMALMRILSLISVSSIQKNIAAELVGTTEARARDLLGWEMGSERKKWLVRLCSRQLALYPLRRRYLERWLRLVRPRLLLVEEGCYGHMAIINATAHENGVPVAEFQHGMVSRGHDGYNIAPFLAASEAYRHTLPDYFLSYGSWWNAQFNAPVGKVIIGNPHRTALLEQSMPPWSGRRNILVLGDGIETELYLQFCHELAKLLSDSYCVIFRPHPLERHRILGMREPVSEGFTIDHVSDIYLSLAEAHAVIAEVSTGLFDAVGLVDRIFVWNTAKSRFSLPEHPFSSFHSAPDLARKLLDFHGDGPPSVDPEEIWASDWQPRFKGFIDGVFSSNSQRRMLPKS